VGIIVPGLPIILYNMLIYFKRMYLNLPLFIVLYLFLLFLFLQNVDYSLQIRDSWVFVYSGSHMAAFGVPHIRGDKRYGPHNWPFYDRAHARCVELAH
jgi:hypothetical protein